MNEDQVVEAVCRYLVDTGCTVTSRCSTREKGIDITGEYKGRKLYVEAKGGTSSREGSNRFGKNYTQSQVFDRVAKGFYTAACLRSKYGDEGIIGLALPDQKMFRRYVGDVSVAAARLNLKLYWVRSDNTVVEEQL